MNERLLLTVPEAAERLGISRAFAYNLVMRGELASVKLGRSRRVPVGELENYVRRLLAGEGNEPIGAAHGD